MVVYDLTLHSRTTFLLYLTQAGHTFFVNKTPASTDHQAHRSSVVALDYVYYLITSGTLPDDMDTVCFCVFLFFF